MFNGLDRRGDSDQTLKGLNLISEATLNVLEPGGGREIIAVEEKRSHVCPRAYELQTGSRAPLSARNRGVKAECERWSCVLVVQRIINSCTFTVYSTSRQRETARCAGGKGCLRWVGYFRQTYSRKPMNRKKRNTKTVRNSRARASSANT